MTVQFEPWPKIARLFRDITITEKIDGTNSAILIEKVHPSERRPQTDQSAVAFGMGHFEDGDDLVIYAQSRTRFITPEKDNFGFARWVAEHAGEIVAQLDAHGGSVGRHFGEWWGQGIQRRYGMDHKIFSLFNTNRYAGLEVSFGEDNTEINVVPVLYEGPLTTSVVNMVLDRLELEGSKAAPGFMKPEGIITYHHAARTMFKTTLENDGQPKGQS